LSAPAAMEEQLCCSILFPVFCFVTGGLLQWPLGWKTVHVEGRARARSDIADVRSVAI
jgi:hypothetical protein